MTATPEHIATAFEDAVTSTAGNVTGRLVKVVDAWSAGRLGTEELETLLVRMLGISNGMARAIADLYAVQIIAGLYGGEPLLPKPIPPDAGAEADRLLQAVETIMGGLDAGGDLKMQLDRLANAELAGAMQDQLVTAYHHHGYDGYRRGLSSDACELCVWLQKAHLDPEGIGYVYPSDKPMHKHTGCRCTPIPVKGDQ